ncbi:porin family protein [uncultured Phocaeicola sp.]|uniref:porin family protein n=1 Tax=uncultured Phocaeicola sp. TaxID=990718 RepID=UPI0025EBC1D0|nr:porin family protein [uncultured Phocaeicola sp.]
MKKVLSTLLLIVCCWLAIPAQAQIHFGLKGGIDVSKMTFSSDLLKGDNRTGFFIGPMLDFTVPVVGVGVDVAALYSQSGLKANDEFSESETLKSIEVPINLKWTIGLGSTLGVYLAAGPQFGFSLNDKLWDNIEAKKCAVSVNIGAGVKLVQHLQIGVNYNIGASKLANVIAEGFETNIRKNAWQVSLAYLF